MTVLLKVHKLTTSTAIIKQRIIELNGTVSFPSTGKMSKYNFECNK